MTKSVNRMISSLICALILLALAVPIAAFAQPAETVTVAYIDHKDFVTKQPDGSYTGYAADYLDRIAQHTGWKYEYVDMDWPTAYEAVKNGEIDFYCVARLTEDRLSNFDFSIYPVCYEEMNIYTLPDSGVYYEDFEAFNGIKIGLLAGSGEIEHFNLYAETNGFTYELREYPLNQDAVNALKLGEVDAVALVNYSVDSDLKMVGNFGISPAYMMSHDGSELMELFSEAQVWLNVDDPDFSNELENRYYGSLQSTTDLLLTRQEAEYIASAPVHTVALSYDMAPIEYYDESAGAFKGVTVDLFGKITEMTGLEFDFVRREDAPVLLSQMENGEVSVVGAMARNADVAQQLHLTQTETFADSSFSLVAKNISELTTDLVVALPAGYPMFVSTARNIGYTNFKEFDSLDACINAVSKGDADLTIIVSMCEVYLLDHARYSDLRSMVLPEADYSICLGTSNFGDNALLLSIIDKCINTLSPREINEIIVSNTMLAQPKQTLVDFLTRYSAVLFVIALLLLGIVVYLILRGQRNKQQRELNLQLKRHHDFLQHLYNTLPCGIFRYSSEPPHRLLSYNAACARIFGFEDEPPVSSETLGSVFDEVADEDLVEKFAECEKAGAPIVFNRAITKKDGAPAYLECFIDSVQTDEGKVYQVVFVDETERTLHALQIEKQYQRELDRTGNRDEGLLFTACINITKQLLVRSDIDVAGIREGMPVDEFLDKVTPELRGLQTEEWLREFRRWFSREKAEDAYDNGHYEDSFKACRRKDERIQWQRVNLTLRLHPAGDLLCFAYVWDITDEQVTNEIMRHMALADCECIICVDTATGRCMQYAVTKDEGLVKSEALYGKSDSILGLTALMTPADSDALRVATSLSNVTEQLAAEPRYQVYATLTDGKARRRDKALTYFYTDKENGILAVTISDITEVRRDQVRHAELLADALAAAERADAAKSQFLSRVSHEMRTPLNAIIGFIELAKDADADTTEHYLKSSGIAANQLLTTINEVLDMSSIESGKLKIAQAPFNFRHMISSITNIYGTQCSQKGVDFQTKIMTPVDDWLVGDELRVNQILINLLGNSIKFTKAGHIWLQITQTSTEDDKVFIRFEVSDTGCGMSEDLMERLFKPYEQENLSTARKYGGSGLGLSIVKNLVSLMDGSILIESELDVGTTVTIDLPFTRSDMEQDIGLRGKVDHLRVLAVDDEESEREYLKAVLGRLGVRYTCVSSGADALEELDRSVEEGDIFNVCIVDWRMPELSGFDTTRKIRSKYGDDVVVIVVSAYDFLQAGDSAREAGANLFISKPVFQSSLFDLFMKLTGGRIAEHVSEPRNWDFAGRRVLLVEDNELSQMVAVGYMSKAGLVADIADNGREAVNMFLASEPGYYGAILMDIQMPVMNGFEATKAIRESDHSDAKTIPIIAQTANAFNEDIARSHSAGMNAHITKPIDPEFLFKTLSAHMGSGEVKEYHDAPADSAPVGRLDKAKLAAVGINYDEGVSRFAGDPLLYEKYLLKFFAEDSFGDLHRQVAAGQYTEAFGTAHDLKSATGNLSIDKLFVKICELVEYLRAGGEGATAVRLCEQAAQLYAKAKEAIKD